MAIKQSLQWKEKGENKSKEREEAKGERDKNFVPLPSTLYITLYSFFLKSLSLNFSWFCCFSYPELSIKTDKNKLRARRER